MIKLIITDDHKLFRDGVASLLKGDGDIQLVAEASSGQELMKLLETTEADIVLMDIALPDKDGLQIVADCRKKHPNVKFIMLTMHNEGQYVVSAVRNGAFGYLIKNADEEELREAIHTVYEDRKYFNKDISALMIDNMAIEESIKKLSTRESEILKMVAKGQTTKEIAGKLHISTRTVETHRVNMMKKMGVQNTAELVRKAGELNLI